MRVSEEERSVLSLQNQCGGDSVALGVIQLFTSLDLCFRMYLSRQ